MAFYLPSVKPDKELWFLLFSNICPGNTVFSSLQGQPVCGSESHHAQHRGSLVAMVIISSSSLRNGLLFHRSNVYRQWINSLRELSHLSLLSLVSVFLLQNMTTKSSVRVLVRIWLRDKGQPKTSHEHSEDRKHLLADKQLSVGVHLLHSSTKKPADLCYLQSLILHLTAFTVMFTVDHKHKKKQILSCSCYKVSFKLNYFFCPLFAVIFNLYKTYFSSPHHQLNGTLATTQ